MNCGNCLFTSAKITALVGGICPECSADYTKPASEDDIKEQVSKIPPLVHIAGVKAKPTPPIVSQTTNEEASPLECETSKTPLQHLHEQVSKERGEGLMSTAEVLAYLKEHKHTSFETGIKAIAATKIFGQGVASAMSKAGLIEVVGNKRGAVYWVKK